MEFSYVAMSTKWLSVDLRRILRGFTRGVLYLIYSRLYKLFMTQANKYNIKIAISTYLVYFRPFSKYTKNIITFT